MQPGNPTSAFDRLHPALKEALYRMRWTRLRPIQVEAIHEIFDGTGDLIIAARTAAGKTEAAFLPILSQLLSDPAPGVRVVYAGPLKALINDQFSRLEELCEHAEVPVHKWHGDVSSSAKRRSRGTPLRSAPHHARVDRITLRKPPPSTHDPLCEPGLHCH